MRVPVSASPPSVFRGAVALLLAVCVCLPALAQRDEDEFVKSVRGTVRDLAGNPLHDAIVFVYSPENTQTRTLRTNDEGIYEVHGLPGDMNYEIRATYGGQESETRLVSAFLAREDNIVSFTLDLVREEEPTGDALSFQTYDGVELRGSFQLPEGVGAPIPVAMLLHGYGESRAVWNDLTERLLREGWAVLALDLRGHGESLSRGAETLVPDENWRVDPLAFPLDLDPALDWLKIHTRLDPERIAVIGSDVGAGLALIAGARYGEVSTVVAMNPNLEETLAMAGTALDFEPRRAYIIAADQTTGERVREFVAGAYRVTVLDPAPASDHTAVWLGTPDTLDQIVRWLWDTY